MNAALGGNDDWMLGQGAADGLVVGVVGAGTMGAGIAQVAAAAGHPVVLMDVGPGAAAAAHARIATALDGLVRKERMTAAERQALLARIVPTEALVDLKGAALVIEVIVEQLDAKQRLLRELEMYVGARAVLASNTSSISITALANGLQHPERLVGMHFFNPVPQMKLVEVVSGAETATSVADCIHALARAWGKTPVHAKSTPGFIVNRIARPFYAEALALLQEQAATPAELDRAMRGAGFRMGPCELMDLIGHDVNYAVTVSVFEANYGDRRFQPSLVQKALIDGGRLGRKTGKGFYDGNPAASAVADVAENVAPPSVEVAGSGAIAQRLVRHLDAAGVAVRIDGAADWIGLRIGDVELHLTDGRTANQLAAQRATARARATIAVIDLPLFDKGEAAVAIAFADAVPPAQREQVNATLQACKMVPVELRDVPGLLVARTVVMLVNEGADAVWQGVCDERAADLAMKLGTNYPAGPFEWLEQMGIDYTVTVLRNLFAAYCSERYRISPLLQQRYWAARVPS